MNNKLDFIFGRRSIRDYKPDAVSDASIRAILEAAMAAPSAVARDPWRFVVLRDKSVRGRIAEKLPHGRMLAQAPIGIVVCGDLDATHDRQLSYMLQDCSAAIENMLLAIHALGLGSCWLGIHPREERIKDVKEVLGLPSSIIPVGGIAIGYPAEFKEPRTRFNPDYVRQDRWA